MEKKTILLIDDDVDFIEQMKTQLFYAGYNVITAESQHEAEEIIHKEKFDMVITDLMMENYDGGFGISYLVKKLFPEIPVVIVTSVQQELGFDFTTQKPSEKKWIKADELLKKPIRFEQLKKVIHKYLHE